MPSAIHRLAKASVLTLAAAACASSAVAADTMIGRPGTSQQPIGHGYVARLTPDHGAHGATPVLMLDVRKGAGASPRNLVEPSGAWHGVEPMQFASREFVGHGEPIFGTRRLLPIRGTRDSILVEVVQAKPASASDWNRGRLTLRLGFVASPRL